MTESPVDQTPCGTPAALEAVSHELRRLRTGMTDVILPFWSTEGFDDAANLFRERFDFAGRSLDHVPQRTMVQARQIHVFSHAARQGRRPEAAAVAERALHSLLNRWDEAPGAGLAYSIHRDGTVHDPTWDSYTHAFVLFALASAQPLLGGPRIGQAAERMLAFVDQRLSDPAAGGLYDRYPDPGHRKSQNPQMHFLEALLALHESFPEGPYLERAAGIVELFTTKIFRPDAAVIPEYCHEDWSMARLGTDAAFFEPGHHFEWIWLLDRYERLAGVKTGETAAALWRSAMDHGRAADGMILDQVGLDLRPNGCNFRLWPHAEGCRAGAVRYESGSEDGAGLAASMVGALNDSFLGRPFAAGWVDRVGPDKRPVTDNVPASSLYHLYGAWMEIERVFGPARPA